MASGVKADQIGDDWSDNEEKTHEIVVEGTDFIEHDEDMRSEQVARKSGPAWGLLETSEPVPKEVVKGGKFRAPKLSDKKAPVVNPTNFPGLADPTSDKKSDSRAEGKSSESKQDDSKSSNPYSKLEMPEAAEEEAKTEKKSQQPRKSNKKKGKGIWNKVETNVKIASTADEINAKDIFAKEPEKVQERYERPQESRNFQFKSSGAGFRNFENKQEAGPFARDGFRNEPVRQDAGPFGSFNSFARDGKDDQGKGSGFGRRVEGDRDRDRERERESEKEKDGELEKPAAWRRNDNAPDGAGNSVSVSAGDGKVPTGGPKKFFNAKKVVSKESIDPLQPKSKEQEESKKDVWGDQVKPARKNPWRTDN